MASILIIEDNDSLRNNLSEILTLEGFEVLQAANGANGIKMLEDHIPDYIFCDIKMPVSDGYDVLTWAKSSATFANIPFYFMTAYEDQILPAEDLQPDGVIAKPFKPNALLILLAGI